MNPARFYDRMVLQRINLYTRSAPGMELKTVLNFVEKHKGFVYEQARWVEHNGLRCIEVQLRARRGSKGICLQCEKPASGYDLLDQRTFEFVPLWGIAVYFLYAPRRVQCPRCGVRVEKMPWAMGKRPICSSYGWFLARWARRLSWKRDRRGLPHQLAIPFSPACKWL